MKRIPFDITAFVCRVEEAGIKMGVMTYQNGAIAARCFHLFAYLAIQLTKGYFFRYGLAKRAFWIYPGKSLNLRSRGIRIVACPSCSRQNFNVIEVVNELETRFEGISEDLEVAIIGCYVNGLVSQRPLMLV